MTDAHTPFTKTQFGENPFFVFCDHASNIIPPSLNALGLPDDILQTHIALDIGSSALGKVLAERLGGEFFQSTVSRLVVDVNRDPFATDVIPVVSDQIPIPGNQMLSDADRQDRIARFHVPYHTGLSAALDAFCTRHDTPMIISVHSFTKRLMGTSDDRPWPVGLLWKHDERSAQSVINALSQTTDWLIGNNQPYDAREFNYSIDRHASPRNVLHLTFEIRQDMIDGPDDVNRLADILSPAIITATDQMNPEG